MKIIVGKKTQIPIERLFLFIANFALLSFLSVTGWFANPSLGPIVLGILSVGVAFGVTLTLTMHEPLESAFTVVPETEQNFFDFAATTSATLAPFGTLILAVLRIVVKVATLPFFITNDCVGLATTPPVGLATLEAATHGRLFTRTQIVCVATAPVARIRYLVETVGHITKVAFPFEPLFAVIIALQPAFALALTALKD